MYRETGRSVSCRPNSCECHHFFWYHGARHACVYCAHPCPKNPAQKFHVISMTEAVRLLTKSLLCVKWSPLGNFCGLLAASAQSIKCHSTPLYRVRPADVSVHPPGTTAMASHNRGDKQAHLKKCQYKSKAFRRLLQYKP